MSIKQKIRNLVTSAAIAASLIAGAPSSANAGNSAEIMAGSANTTLDVKTNTELAKRANLFVRNRTNVDYNGKVNYFGLADVSYNLIGGLDVVIENQFAPGSAIIPRAGFEYFKKIGNLSLFNMATAYLNRNPDLEIFSTASYSRNLTDKLAIAAGAENIVNFGSKGFNYSVQRLRAGLSVGKLEFGAATDLSETNSSNSKNIGTYAVFKF
jgi:hypothetical protein